MQEVLPFVRALQKNEERCCYFSWLSLLCRKAAIFVVFALFIEGETERVAFLLNKGVLPLINYSKIQKINVKVKVKRIIFYEFFKYI